MNVHPCPEKPHLFVITCPDCDYKVRMHEGYIAHNLVGHMRRCTGRDDTERDTSWGPGAIIAVDDPSQLPTPAGHPEYMRCLDEIRNLHIRKSGGYGTGEDPFANFTAIGTLANQPRFVYALHRGIEKATRCLSLIEQERFDELGEEFLDMASLFLCAEAMRREDC